MSGFVKAAPLQAAQASVIQRIHSCAHTGHQWYHLTSQLRDHLRDCNSASVEVHCQTSLSRSHHRRYWKFIDPRTGHTAVANQGPSAPLLLLWRVQAGTGSGHHTAR
jgi:hypothetical protein